ncbi:hypothetical protein NPIL_409351 [Nephila pilipes]|uniref:Uncharacterized protein n=1 Tax=Nephila pilipes TaxID=299642 RepID=A0A8X6MYY6_NEPPI|nr:hypothetical protein NPIL_409351 [Nephila pilipes]
MPLKKHFISIERKLQILDQLKKGENVSFVTKSLDLIEVIILVINKNEQKIRHSVAAGCSISSNMTFRSEETIIELMKKALTIWIEACSKADSTNP